MQWCISIVAAQKLELEQKTQGQPRLHNEVTLEHTFLLGGIFLHNITVS